MKRLFLKNKVNKLTFSFMIIIVCVTVLAFTVALSMGYYNVNSTVDKIFTENVTNYHNSIVQNMIDLDSKLNLTTYHIVGNKQIHNIISGTKNYSVSETKNISSSISNFTADHIGYVDLFILNTRTNEIYTRRLIPSSTNPLSDYMSKYINKEVFLENCRQKKRNYTSPLDDDFVILTTYDFRGYAIAYIFEKNILFDSLCKYTYENYETALYCDDNLILSRNENNNNFSEVLPETTDKFFSHTSGSYTILSDITSQAISEFYKPFTKQIVIFSLIIILIGIFALILSINIFGRTSETYINNLLSRSLQHHYTAIKSTIQRAIRNQYLQQSEEEFIDEYFSKTDYKKLYCCQIKLDNINTMLLSNSYKNIAMYMQKIKLLFEDRLSHLGTCIIIDIDFDTIGIILTSNELSDDSILINNLSSARADIDKLLSLTVTVALTEPIFSHSEIFNAFLHLGQLMKYRFFTGYNSTITDKDEIKNTTIYPISTQQQILTYMLSRKTDKFMFLLTEFFNEAKKINCDDAKKWILDLSMALLKHHPSTESAVEIISQLSNAEIIDEQFDILKKHFIDSAPSSEENSATSETFLARVNDIIESEYQNLDFNLSSLAEQLEISSVYAGKKFKTIFEKNFTVYLSEYRIHKAIEFMRNTAYTTTEIASMCGFSSATYFIKTFKKVTDMTPNEYRKTM